MSTDIHPSAVIDPGARLGSNVRVGPFSLIGAGVEIGDGSVIGPHCSVTGPTRIGRDNHLVGHVAAGGDPQDKKFAGERTELVIGDRNIIREFVTLNRGTGTGGTRPARQAARPVVAPMNSTTATGTATSAAVCPGNPCHTPTASPSRPGIRGPSASVSAAAATAPSRA